MEALLTVGGPSVMVMDSGKLALLPLELFAVMLTIVGPPTVVGVPEMTPVDVLKLRPLGSVPVRL